MTSLTPPCPPNALDFFKGAKFSISQFDLDLDLDFERYFSFHQKIFDCAQKMQDLSEGMESYLFLANNVDDDALLCSDNSAMSAHDLMHFKSKFENIIGEIDALHHFSKTLTPDIINMFPGILKHTDLIARPCLLSFFKVMLDDNPYHSKTAQGCANLVAMYFICKEKILYDGKEAQKIKALASSSQTYLINFTQEEKERIEMRMNKMREGLSLYHKTLEHYNHF